MNTQELQDKLLKLLRRKFVTRSTENKSIKTVWLAGKDIQEFEAFFSSALTRMETATREEMEINWDKAVEFLYCEHCGKLMSQDRVDKLKFESLKKD